MEFEWDEKKRILNIEKHGIDFIDVKDIFYHPVLERVDVRIEYGEERYIAIGRIRDVLIIVVYTLRGKIYRVISARKANQKERKIYEERYK